jgi:hypothetical protein
MSQDLCSNLLQGGCSVQRPKGQLRARFAPRYSVKPWQVIRLVAVGVAGLAAGFTQRPQQFQHPPVGVIACPRHQALGRRNLRDRACADIRKGVPVEPRYGNRRQASRGTWGSACRSDCTIEHAIKNRVCASTSCKNGTPTPPIKLPDSAVSTASGSHVTIALASIRRWSSSIGGRTSLVRRNN